MKQNLTEIHGDSGESGLRGNSIAGGAVIPAQEGIQCHNLESDLRGNDEKSEIRDVTEILSTEPALSENLRLPATDFGSNSFIRSFSARVETARPSSPSNRLDDLSMAPPEL
jgi:hypothetical protein